MAPLMTQSICAVAFGSYSRFAGLFAYSAMRAFPGCQVVLLVDRSPSRRNIALASLGQHAFGGEVIWDRSVIRDLRHTPKTLISGGFLKIARWLAPGELFTGDTVLFADVDSLFLVEKRDVYWRSVEALRQPGVSYHNFKRQGEERLTGGNHWVNRSYFAQVERRQRRIRDRGVPPELQPPNSNLNACDVRDENILWWICEATEQHPSSMPEFKVDADQTRRFPGIHYGVGRNLRTINIRLTADDRESLRHEMALDVDLRNVLQGQGNVWLDNVIRASDAMSLRPTVTRRLSNVYWRLRILDRTRNRFRKLFAKTAHLR